MTNVVWVDPTDGGYKTGTRVLLDGQYIQREHTERFNKNQYTASLVKHSCDGRLEFVPNYLLSHWPTRKERGEE